MPSWFPSSLLFRAVPALIAVAVLVMAALFGSGSLSGPASAAADTLKGLMPDTAASDPQEAYTLRLHAEVATESACMSPPDDVAPAAVDALSRRDRAAYCRCFARVVARDASTADQMDLIDAQGEPPSAVATEARRACLPGRR
ncbi:hypothetical protein C882_2974 [Caenispirillum salinarum AK4]|uniref:Uncharacterized protein n=1 Tax=Caenispirillum salinarum AK4 TaxID=1238182 RepID=K9H0U9_9PROT|nr:hypothetical protein [Caenispirillum salinarum]EKV31910.1 hypothetical protein C882_2974 [Caenispirillum salinarum AK4]